MELAKNYLVVHSPHAELLVLGYKNVEWRSWSQGLSGKTVAVAVSKKIPSQKHIEEVLDFWELTKSERTEFGKLFAQKSNGKIIGQVKFGEHSLDENGFDCVPVEEFSIWSQFLPSPGGLGLRKIPQ